jgi:hypothetical protein
MKNCCETREKQFIEINTNFWLEGERGRVEGDMDEGGMDEGVWQSRAWQKGNGSKRRCRKWCIRRRRDRSIVA